MQAAQTNKPQPYVRTELMDMSYGILGANQVSMCQYFVLLYLHSGVGGSSLVLQRS